MLFYFGPGGRVGERAALGVGPAARGQNQKPLHGPVQLSSRLPHHPHDRAPHIYRVALWTCPSCPFISRALMRWCLLVLRLMLHGTCKYAEPDWHFCHLPLYQFTLGSYCAATAFKSFKRKQVVNKLPQVQSQKWKGHLSQVFFLLTRCWENSWWCHTVRAMNLLALIVKFDTRYRL